MLQQSVEDLDLVTRIQRGKPLTVSGLADMLGYTAKTIYRLIDSGELPAYKVANGLRLDPVKTARWLRGTETV